MTKKDLHGAFKPDILRENLMNRLTVMLTLFLIFPGFVMAEEFNLEIGTIQLPPAFKLGNEIDLKGVKTYYFTSVVKGASLKTLLMVNVQNHTIKESALSQLEPKSAALACAKESFMEMSKMVPLKQLSKENDSLIGGQYAVEIATSGTMQGVNFHGNIRCMKYENYLVSTSIIEDDALNSIGVLRDSVTNIKLNKISQ